MRYSKTFAETFYKLRDQLPVFYQLFDYNDTDFCNELIEAWDSMHGKKQELFTLIVLDLILLSCDIPESN